MSNNEVIVCPECKNAVFSSTSTCPNCGYPISKITDNTGINGSFKSKKLGTSTIIGIILICVAFVPMILGVNKITSKKYKSYKEMYQVCMDEYNSNWQTAQSYKSGYLKEGYKSIASRYFELAKECKENVSKLNKTATVYFGCSGVIILIGVLLIIRRKKWH